MRLKFPLHGAPVYESVFCPRSTVLVVDNLGAFHKVINIASYLAEADALSLCVGEMK